METSEVAPLPTTALRLRVTQAKVSANTFGVVDVPPDLGRRTDGGAALGASADARRSFDDRLRGPKTKTIGGISTSADSAPGRSFARSNSFDGLGGGVAQGKNVLVEWVEVKVPGQRRKQPTPKAAKEGKVGKAAFIAATPGALSAEKREGARQRLHLMLKEHFLFDSFTLAQRDEVVRAMRYKFVRAGMTIAGEGEPATKFFACLAGGIDLTPQPPPPAPAPPSEKPLLVAQVGPGARGARRRSAREARAVSATAAVDSEVYVLSRDVFRALKRAAPAAAADGASRSETALRKLPALAQLPPAARRDLRRHARGERPEGREAPARRVRGQLAAPRHRRTPRARRCRRRLVVRRPRRLRAARRAAAPSRRPPLPAVPAAEAGGRRRGRGAAAAAAARRGSWRRCGRWRRRRRTTTPSSCSSAARARGRCAWRRTAARPASCSDARGAAALRAVPAPSVAQPLGARGALQCCPRLELAAAKDLDALSFATKSTALAQAEPLLAEGGAAPGLTLLLSGRVAHRRPQRGGGGGAPRPAAKPAVSTSLGTAQRLGRRVPSRSPPPPRSTASLSHSTARRRGASSRRRPARARRPPRRRGWRRRRVGARVRTEGGSDARDGRGGRRVRGDA